jgi:hypothetical protein
LHEIAPDIAYRRLAIVNVERGAGERAGRSTQELSFGRRIKICVNVPAIQHASSVAEQ